MSVQWLAWVFEAAEVSGTQRLVLLSLANHADDSGVCWPSLNTVAREARVSRRRAEDAVRGLVAAGFVEREVNAAPVARHAGYRSNLYRLVRSAGTSAHDVTGPPQSSGPDTERPPVSSGPDETGPPHTSYSGVDDSDQQPPPNRPPKPSVEPSVEPSAPAAAAPSLLDEASPEATTDPEPSARDIAEQRFETHFWSIWPRRHGRKVNKGKALAQWLRLSVAHQRDAVKGARVYEAHCRTTKTFPKDADRWLRDHLWKEWLTSDVEEDPPAGIGSAAHLPNGGRLALSMEERAAMGITVGVSS